MARYIEQLNENTDPVAADFLWIVDTSADATDKDKKLLLGTLLTSPTFTNGAILTATAGGFTGTTTGKIGYDSTKKRFVLQHETHNYPVPIDPRDGCVNRQRQITY